MYVRRVKGKHEHMREMEDKIGTSRNKKIKQMKGKILKIKKDFEINSKLDIAGK